MSGETGIPVAKESDTFSGQIESESNLREFSTQ